MKLFAAVLGLLAIGISSAKADSDGYFCSSSAFLAYEFSFSKEPSDQHKLYVHRFGSEVKNDPQWLRIPNFQVHSMKCFPDRVELIGWEKRYVYSVSPTVVTAVLEGKLPMPGKLPEGFSPANENLGSFSPVTRGAMPNTYTYTLTTNRPEGNYEIRVLRKKTNNPCQALVESSLAKGEQVAVLSLYSGTVRTECGE